jgi:hypothetical protein
VDRGRGYNNRADNSCGAVMEIAGWRRGVLNKEGPCCGLRCRVHGQGGQVSETRAVREVNASHRKYHMRTGTTLQWLLLM